jgi:hypothetical protein
MELRLPKVSKTLVGNTLKQSPYSAAKKEAVLREVAAGTSIRAAAALHGIKNHSVVGKWIKMKSEGKPFNNSIGRPKEMDRHDLQAFVSGINSYEGGEYGMPESKAMELGTSIIIENRRKRKLNVDDSPPPSRKTLRTIMRQIEARAVVADSTTIARRRAEHNVNNAIGFCAGILSVVPHIDSRMVGNVDASQYIYESNSEKVVYCGQGPKSLKKFNTIKSNPEEDGGCKLGFAIKYYCQITSGGDAGPPIYIVADNSMPSNVIDVHKMKIGWGVEPEKFSYLVFMKTRTPEKEFYRWFIKEYLAPFVSRLRAAYETDSWFLLLLDGEHKQIEIFKEKDMQLFLNANCICIGKTSASRTAMEQPCDVGSVFKASKSRFRAEKYTSQKYAIPDSFVDQFKTIWKIHCERFKLSGCKLNADHRQKAMKGIYLLNRCLARSINPDMIMDSFHLTGIIRKSTGTPDAHAMLTRCRTLLDSNDIDQIMVKMEFLKKKMLNQRVLFDNIDFKGISKAGNMKSRDSFKSVSQKGFMFLTDPNLLVNKITGSLIDSTVSTATVSVEHSTSVIIPEEVPALVLESSAIISTPSMVISEGISVSRKRTKKQNLSADFVYSCCK